MRAKLRCLFNAINFRPIYKIDAVIIFELRNNWKINVSRERDIGEPDE